MEQEEKEAYMALALSLAEGGVGKTNPNPIVGAVIVKNHKIIGQGYHMQYGGPHAERNALSDCKESPKGACIFVTLEPCCHQGKTGPCTEAIIESGITEVYVGATDPNPLVGGKGIQRLKSQGILVETGILETACMEQNQVFFHYIQQKRPFVVMKYAMTMDGKIATTAGESRWITGEEARKRVHEDRNRYMGIMTGVNTVIADDPELNCRMPGGRDPVRIICDSHMRLPLDSKIALTAKKQLTILAVSSRNEEKKKACQEMGIQVLQLPEREGRVDLQELMQCLGKLPIDSILLEGGGTLNEAALKAGIVQKVQCYIGGRLFGGKAAKTPVEGEGFLQIKDSIQLRRKRILEFGADILIESEVI